MNKSLITEPLGLFGWSHLEPIILAALASEAPMLLIGKHGSAKSFILERLAEALKLEFRCYNASLINYDDLVGIPIPINNNTSLSYISNQSSIWDCQVVFIDELNRTKPELQNKLFPIIYDKKVQGIKLSKLKYRWAALNPPSSEDEEEDYLGAMPLDMALADRFTYIIEVPTWDDLSENDKRKMINDNHLGKHEFIIDINELINKVKEEYQNLVNSKKDDITNYIITLMQLLKNSFGYFSSRRATILEDSFLYILASYKVLGISEDDYFQNAAYLHIQNTIPNIVNNKIDKNLLINICAQALKLSKLGESIEKKILLIDDPVNRLKSVIKNKSELNCEVINDVITSSLSSFNDEKERRAMALFVYLSFRTNRNIYASVLETIANEIRPILKTYKHNSFEYLPTKKIADSIVAQLNEINDNKKYKKYLNNYLYSFFPEEYGNSDEVKKACDFFVNTWEELDL